LAGTGGVITFCSPGERVIGNHKIDTGNMKKELNQAPLCLASNAKRATRQRQIERKPLEQGHELGGVGNPVRPGGVVVRQENWEKQGRQASAETVVNWAERGLGLSSSLNSGYPAVSIGKRRVQKERNIEHVIIVQPSIQIRLPYVI